MTNCQEMGETREPMAYDCWMDAWKIAENYDHMGVDLWIMFAAKQHVSIPNGIVQGWEVSVAKPPRPVLGVLVFHWSHKEKELKIDKTLSLPYDVPLDGVILSEDERDFNPTLAETAKSSYILLA